MPLTRTARARMYVAVSLFTLMAAMLVAEANSGALCTVDEPGWITSGYVSWNLATHLEPPSRWSEAFSNPRLGPWGHQNPPVAKLVIGMATALAKEPSDPVQYMWRWPGTYLQNLNAGNLPPASLLAGVRTAIACFGIVALLLVYLVARELTGPGRWAALLAPLLLFSYESFRVHASQVYSDVPQMGFTLLGVWCLLLWRRRQRDRLLVCALLAMGLACATKFSAGALVIGAAVFVALVPAPLLRRIARAAATVVIPTAVFVVVNPHLWFHPVTNTLAATRLWSSGIALQQQDPNLAGARVTERLQAVGLTLSRVAVWPAHGQETPGFSGLVPGVLVAALACVALLALIVVVLRMARRQPRPRQLALMLGAAGLVLPVAASANDLAPLVGVLVLLGAWRLGRRVGGLERYEAAGGFAAIYVTTWVATVMWLPFDWPRYYLPLVGLTPVLGAVGALEIEAALVDRTDVVSGPP